MSAKWRPEGWGNPYIFPDADGLTDIYKEPEVLVFEAGADAMMEALKKQGQFVFNDPNVQRPSVTVVQNGVISNESLILGRSVKKGESGYLVFIPDEGK